MCLHLLFQLLIDSILLSLLFFQTLHLALHALELRVLIAKLNLTFPRFLNLGLCQLKFYLKFFELALGSLLRL